MYKRALLSEIKNEFTIIEDKLPDLQEGEVLIALKAAALNRRDYWITQGLYPGLQLPCTPGSDGSGVVEGIAGDVSSCSVGDEVIINPALNWGSDQRAQDAAFQVLGMPRIGTHATHIIVAADRIHAKPEHFNWQEAAALPLAYATAYRALFSQAQMRPGERILITGIGGGVALAALQLAHAADCEVIVTSSDAQKSKRAQEFGAVASYNYREPDWHKQLLKNHGPIDVMIDGSGGDNINAAISLCVPGGRIVSYGATAGAPQQLDVFKLFWKQIQIIGSTMASDNDFNDMLAFVNEQRIVPVIDSQFSLNDINQAYARQASPERMGKIVLDCKDI